MVFQTVVLLVSCLCCYANTQDLTAAWKFLTEHWQSMAAAYSFLRNIGKAKKVTKAKRLFIEVSKHSSRYSGTCKISYPDIPIA